MLEIGDVAGGGAHAKHSAQGGNNAAHQTLARMS